ncbi:hypothetical protein GCM10023176_07440 [Micromonospora coerulea]|uniref:Uncharacterized protein n=1 Tax=Micromonospora coerulea TaxID=47856 RepID=A0ABP8S9B6_9ACTN
MGPDETADALVASHLDVCVEARAVVAAGSLDDVVRTNRGAPVNLRSIPVHSGPVSSPSTSAVAARRRAAPARC